jgi:hypothetical protein
MPEDYHQILTIKALTPDSLGRYTFMNGEGMLNRDIVEGELSLVTR